MSDLVARLREVSKRLTDLTAAALMDEAADALEAAEGQLHSCPTCGEKCVECKCYRERLDAAEARIEELGQLLDQQQGRAIVAELDLEAAEARIADYDNELEMALDKLAAAERVVEAARVGLHLGLALAAYDKRQNPDFCKEAVELLRLFVEFHDTNKYSSGDLHIILHDSRELLAGYQNPDIR